MSGLDFDSFVEDAPSSEPGPRVGALAPPDPTEIEAAVRRLPPLPALLQELLRELRDKNADLGRLVERISSDPALTTRVLKMANSPFYMRHAEVVEVGRAVMTLGFKTVSNLVVAASLRGSMASPGRVPGFERNGIFRHSLAVGLGCARLGTRVAALRANAELLFVAGLLHDVGRVALAPFYRERAEAFQSRDRGSLAPSVERDLLQTDHQRVGALVMERWGLPEELAPCIANHHGTVEGMGGDAPTLAVALVDAWWNERGFARTQPHPVDEAHFDALCRALGEDRETMERVFDGLEEEVQSILGSFA